jgi:anti-anti-sigma factor
MEPRDGVLVVRGEIDAESARALARAVREASVATGEHRLDLRQVRFIDSRGIEVLFELAAEGLEIVVAEGSLLQRILHTVGIGQVAKVVARP